MKVPYDEVLECHVRAFSRIEGLQEEYSIRYLLCRSAGELFIVVQQTGTKPCTMTHPAHGGKAYARRILQFLYENSVPAHAAGELIEDL